MSKKTSFQARYRGILVNVVIDNYAKADNLTVAALKQGIRRVLQRDTVRIRDVKVQKKQPKKVSNQNKKSSKARSPNPGAVQTIVVYKDAPLRSAPTPPLPPRQIKARVPSEPRPRRQVRQLERERSVATRAREEAARIRSNAAADRRYAQMLRESANEGGLVQPMGVTPFLADEDYLRAARIARAQAESEAARLAAWKKANRRSPVRGGR